jgi:hypothetical protein
MVGYPGVSRNCSRAKEIAAITSGAITNLQLVLALGVKKLMGAIVIGFGDEDFREAIQIAIVRQAGVHKFLGADDTVLLEHDDKHLGVHDGTSVEELHAWEFNHGWSRRSKRRRNGHGFTRIS